MTKKTRLTVRAAAQAAEQARQRGWLLGRLREFLTKEYRAVGTSSAMRKVPSGYVWVEPDQEVVDHLLHDLLDQAERAFEHATALESSKLATAARRGR